jgi:hypothetical protein
MNERIDSIESCIESIEIKVERNENNMWIGIESIESWIEMDDIKIDKFDIFIESSEK